MHCLQFRKDAIEGCTCAAGDGQHDPVLLLLSKHGVSWSWLCCAVVGQMYGATEGYELWRGET